MNITVLQKALEGVTTEDVARALDRESLGEQDIMALLSPAAALSLETLAQRARDLTLRRFGRTMQLYAPLYLSNECVNRCTYCGFSHGLAITRRTLSVEEVVAEARILHSEGFRHVLLVSGESPRVVDLAYLEAVARALNPLFDSLSLEVGTFELAGYRRLVAAGFDGLTLYQETYAPEIYQRVHLAGPKRRYDRRLRAIEQAGQAGFRTLGIGALLGLGPFRLEAAAMLLHGRGLGSRYWRSRIAISFPRIRQHAGGSAAPFPVSDRDLAQMICVARLALPNAELVLSTREPAHLRDHLLRLGITRMSAGSRTDPGGYGVDGSARGHAGEQFSIEDERPAREVARRLSEDGFDPVWKDFDRSFVGPDWVEAPR